MVLYSNYCHSISKILYLDELAFVQYKLVIEKHRTAKTTNAYTLMLFLLHPIKANEFCACSVILIHMEKIAYGGLVNRLRKWLSNLFLILVNLFQGVLHFYVF